MLNRYSLAAAGVTVAVLLWSAGALPVRAQSPGSAALTGQVSSQEEGPMEGVLVSAKGAGITVTVTVVSDSRGRYSFPRAKLQPGKYSLTIRAVGYDMDAPGAVKILPNQTAQVNLKLNKTGDLASQLTNAEWTMSFPGTDEQKSMLVGCTSCHTLQRVAESNYAPAALVDVMKRMGTYAPPSTPLRPVKLPYVNEPAGLEILQKRAQFLSTVNLGLVTKREYPLKTLPRPRSEATKVVITEYDLPRRETEPHDVSVDADGMVWYSDFGSPYLGRLNPRTAEVKEYRVPELKAGFPSGSLDVEFDRDAAVWVARLFQGGVARFDKKTERFTSWSVPKQYNDDRSRTTMVVPQHDDVDGKVWFDDSTNRMLHRVDIQTSQADSYSLYGDHKEGHSIYSIATDSQNNGYFSDLTGSNIGTVDAKTGKVTLYPTPTRNSSPRRIRMDLQDRLWFGENSANRVGMFDTKTKQFQEWLVPTPWSNPYDAVADKNGEVWAGGMGSDRVVRLNPKTGKVIEYLLPKETNIRRVFVDNSTTPVTFWVGNNHGASIVKLEPLD